MARKTTYERNGIIYVELLPDDATPVDYGKGIPLSPRIEDIEAIHPFWPPHVHGEFLQECQRRGLIEFIDYLRPTATTEVRAALNAVFKPDVVRTLDYMRKVTIDVNKY